MNNFRILALGDICGPRSADYLCAKLWKIRGKYKINMVCANGENSSEPNGIDKETATKLLSGGVDVITTGNHVFRKSGIFSFLDDEKRILRPLNYPPENPGHGDAIVTVDGMRVLVMNVLGQAFLDPAESPFYAVEKCLERNKNQYDFAILDIHAESTGEKKSLAYEFGDRISVIYGTHTHVQTSDADVLDGRCAYTTDLGMCGAKDSVLGVRKEAVIHRMKTKMLSRFDFADGEIVLEGAIFEVDRQTAAGLSGKNIRITGEEYENI